VVVPVSGEGSVHAGLAGLLRTAQLEHPKLVGQVIGVAPSVSAADLAEILAESAGSPEDALMRVEAGVRSVASWEEIAPPADADLPWKSGGVYLISGGAGGLGLLLAEAAARAVSSPILVLVGRSVLSEGLRSRLSGLEALGARIEYRSLDVSDHVAVSALVSEVVAAHGRLDGVVHAAGVLRDGLVAGKSAADLRAVLAPKVSGLVALDEATRDVALEWLVCFSSITAVWGNVGQADYAAANGFLDSYAAYRNALVARGLRRGRTVSIN